MHVIFFAKGASMIAHFTKGFFFPLKKLEKKCENYFSSFSTILFSSARMYIITCAYTTLHIWKNETKANRISKFASFSFFCKKSWIEIKNENYRRKGFRFVFIFSLLYLNEYSWATTLKSLELSNVNIVM